MSPTRHEIIEILDEQPSVAWTGRTWRHVFGTQPALSSNVTGARWNPSDVEAMYCSIDRATALAEGDHAIAVQPLRPRAARYLWRIDVELRNALDLSNPTLLKTLGVGTNALRADDHSACRAVGEAAYWLGRDGLLVPSARGAGLNIVILVGNLEPDVALVAVDSEEL
jgi:RES domain-containing protein